MTEIVDIISTVGFPIACCCAMAWYVKYITDKNREQIEAMNQKHKEEMDSVTEAINNNTLALIKLCDEIQNKKEGEKSA